jgi:hypothetical protein
MWAGLFDGTGGWFGDKQFAAEDELDTGLLKDVLALIHPDRHPPQHKAKATEVAQRLGGLYVLPPKPEEPRDGYEHVGHDYHVQAVTDEDQLPASLCDGRCQHLPFALWCNHCLAENERKWAIRRRAKRLMYAAEECFECERPLDAVWRIQRGEGTLPHCESCWRRALEQVRYELRRGGLHDTKPCVSCGRDVTNLRTAHRRRWTCSERCSTRALKAEDPVEPVKCANEDCGKDFTPDRKDSRYCSNACRQSAYRKRKVARA